MASSVLCQLFHRLLVVRQRIVFGSLVRQKRVREIISCALKAAVEQHEYIRRQYPDQPFFEHSEIVHGSQVIVHVKYLFVLLVYYDLVLRCVLFFLPEYDFS